MQANNFLLTNRKVKFYFPNTILFSQKKLGSELKRLTTSM